MADTDSLTKQFLIFLRDTKGYIPGPRLILCHVRHRDLCLSYRRYRPSLLKDTFIQGPTRVGDM